MDYANSFFHSGDGRLFTAFTDIKFQTDIFEELTLSMNMRYSIKSITHKKVYVSNEVNK
jgi:hypothetical protein